MGLKKTFVHLYHREPEHNLGSADKDRAILEAVGDGMEIRGLAVRYFDRPPVSLRERPGLVLSMSRDRDNCRRLDELYPGVPVVNPVSSVLLTRRMELYPLLEKSGVPFPKTVLYRPEDAEPPFPFPFWLKRHDYHHLLPGDVRRVDSRPGFEEARVHFRKAGQSVVFAQIHQEGIRYKFYAVRDPESGEFLFLHFREPEGERRRGALITLLERVLEGTDLAVFGGDLLADPDGMLYPVDINAWPSFSGCREGAAHAIAEYGMRLSSGDASVQ